MVVTFHKIGQIRPRCWNDQPCLATQGAVQVRQPDTLGRCFEARLQQACNQQTRVHCRRGHSPHQKASLQQCGKIHWSSSIGSLPPTKPTSKGAQRGLFVTLAGETWGQTIHGITRSTVEALKR